MTSTQKAKLDEYLSGREESELLRLIHALVTDLEQHDGLVAENYGPWPCKRDGCTDPACEKCGGTNRTRSSDLLTELIGPYTKGP